jgi:hypothetical protein
VQNARKAKSTAKLGEVLAEHVAEGAAKQSAQQDVKDARLRIQDTKTDLAVLKSEFKFGNADIALHGDRSKFAKKSWANDMHHKLLSLDKQLQADEAALEVAQKKFSVTKAKSGSRKSSAQELLSQSILQSIVEAIGKCDEHHKQYKSDLKDKKKAVAALPKQLREAGPPAKAGLQRQKETLGEECKDLNHKVAAEELRKQGLNQLLQNIKAGKVDESSWLDHPLNPDHDEQGHQAGGADASSSAAAGAGATGSSESVQGQQAGCADASSPSGAGETASSEMECKAAKALRKKRKEAMTETSATKRMREGTVDAPSDP